MASRLVNTAFEPCERAALISLTRGRCPTSTANDYVACRFLAATQLSIGDRTVSRMDGRGTFDAVGLAHF